MDTLTLIRPDDWHSHLRDGSSLTQTSADMARYMGRVIVMPNLVPPVTNARLAAEYRQRILRSMQDAPRQFDPLMTLYLTDGTSAEDIREAAAIDWLAAVKLYPAGATTNSAAGVKSLEALYPVLATMEEVDLPLLVHGEVTDAEVDIFDREAAFIGEHLAPIVERFPGLRVVMEHITTADAVDFVKGAGSKVAATITAHHLLLNRNDMLVGGIKPHYYCLPILKRRQHQEALREAATGTDRSFFLGTDSAPHEQEAKESACGCAGVYTAHASLELYAEVFEEMNALERLEDFASLRGPDFYARPRNEDTVTLRRVAWEVPGSIPLGDSRMVPLRAGETLRWQVLDAGAA
ncbi:dihydroorotase [Congregibacter litoralis]|uniref:Dihydroorotase n=1 Tax=Congregibacter litoralis KT71 TaxID=314285 RepID=A4AA15_9GAMM|nr:dihydroorotase [Congregibacter litoralis]EAQ97332.1 dihydroorotase [Congregibacter litoralis KT71]